MTNTTDYLALVGRNTTDYVNVFKPGSLFLAEDAGTVYMSGFTGDTFTLQWRVWIPPGTRSFQSTMYVYASPPESKVLMRMHQPPVGNVSNVTPENSAAVDLTNVLSLLFQGAEIPCYTPAEAGNMKLSAGMMDSPVVTTTGGWLYIKALQVPGNKIYKLDTYISADKAKYIEWYNSATWDVQGNPVLAEPIPVMTFEDKVARRTVDTGLAEALRRLSGGKPDQELIEVLIKTEVWATLVEFAKVPII